MSEQRCVVTLHKGIDKANFMQEMHDAGFTVHNEKPESLRNFDLLMTAEQVEDLKTDSRVIDVRVGSKIENGGELLHNIGRTGNRTSIQGFYDADKTDWGKWMSTHGTRSFTLRPDGWVDGITASGKNVDIVICDSGILADHPEWKDPITGVSRLQQVDWPAEAGLSGSYTQGPQHYTDQYGHGTHCSSTAAGARFGWAPSANIYAIKIFDTDAFGTSLAINLMRLWHLNKSNDNPTIMSNSWGYFAPYTNITGGNYRGTPWTATTMQSQYGMVESQQNVDGDYIFPVHFASVDADIQDCIDAGIIVVAAAGNDKHKVDIPGGDDYDNYWTSSVYGTRYYHRGTTPGHGDVITVGAMDFGNGSTSGWNPPTNNIRSSFSNAGPGVDLYAPGSWIMGAIPEGCTIWDQYNNDYRGNYVLDSNYKAIAISGTSMACPQVTGVIAQLAEARRKWNHYQFKDYIVQLAWDNHMKGTGQTDDYTSSSTIFGGPNKLLKAPFISTKKLTMSNGDSDRAINFFVKYPKTTITEGEDLELYVFHDSENTDDYWSFYPWEWDNTPDTDDRYDSLNWETGTLQRLYYSTGELVRNVPSDAVPMYTVTKITIPTKNINATQSRSILLVPGTSSSTFNYEQYTSMENYLTLNPNAAKITLLPSGIPVPTRTYTLSGPSTVTEGDGTFVVTLTTTNVPDGTIVPFNITSTSGNWYYELSDGSGDGIPGRQYFIINNNTGTASFFVLQNEAIESTQTLTISVDDGANQDSLTINVIDDGTTRTPDWSRVQLYWDTSSSGRVYSLVSGSTTDYYYPPGAKLGIYAILYNIPAGTTFDYEITVDQGNASDYFDNPTGTLTVTDTPTIDNSMRTTPTWVFTLKAGPVLKGNFMTVNITSATDSAGNAIPSFTGDNWAPFYDDTPNQTYSISTGTFYTEGPDRIFLNNTIKTKTYFVGDTVELTVTKDTKIGRQYSGDSDGEYANLSSGTITLNPSEPTGLWIWYAGSSIVEKIVWLDPSNGGTLSNTGSSEFYPVSFKFN